jgi:hypothetical protein
LYAVSGSRDALDHPSLKSMPACRALCCRCRDPPVRRSRRRRCRVVGISHVAGGGVGPRGKTASASTSCVSGPAWSSNSACLAGPSMNPLNRDVDLTIFAGLIASSSS